MHDYVLIITSVTEKVNKYLKIREDATAEYAIYNSVRQETKRGKITLERKLYGDVFHWAQKHAEKYSGWVMGEAFIDYRRFSVDVTMDKLGVSKDIRYVFEYKFDNIEGHEAITELLKLPELEEFVKEEEAE